ncbi:MAG TPA: hypothetical protein VGV91_12230 [Rubrobacter sp.]|nr:hypothetical protein [Rubrobacter sp.]
MAATALAIVLFSVPSSFEHYRSVCSAASEACSQRAPAQPTPEGVRHLREAGLSAGTYAVLNVAIDKVFQPVWFAVGALIFFRRSDDRMALLVSAFLVAFGTVTVDATGADALVADQQAWWLPVEAVQITGEVCVVLFFLRFPGGRFVPRWTRWLALAFIAFVLSLDLFPELYSGSPPLKTISIAAFSAMVVSLVWSQIYRYRNALSAAQRRQARWVVFGTALGVAGTFPSRLPRDLSLVGGDTPFLLLVLEAGFAASLLLVPLSIGVAVLRSHLFDIDVLINRTLVYGTLTALLATAYLGGVAATQAVFQSLTGQRELPQLAIVASTLAIAALFNPLRRRIQTLIDRRFYRGKYDAERTLAAFSVRLRSETDLETLSNDLMGVIGTTVRPEHASLWLRPEAAPGGKPADQHTLIHRTS